MEVKRPLRLSPDLAAATLAVLLPSVLVAIWLTPRAAIPAELPPLALDREAVRASIEREHELAGRAPEGEDATLRRELYEAQNLAELRGEAREVGEHRRARLREVVARIEAAHGPEAIAAIRAADVERMIPALASGGDDEERARALGDFRSALERWSALDGARRVAPEIVIRTLFAARWNAIHGAPLTAGLDDVRLQAYHGWLGLHGDAAEGAMRAGALAAYAAAGGPHADEARGVLAWRAGDWALAEDAFRRAHAASGSVRLRNHAIAASIAGSGPPAEP